MATETKSDRTKDEVARLHKEGKSPQEIAGALGKTPATVYNHLRNLGFGHGKRGRPPKSENGKAKVTTPRPRPGSKPAAKTPSKPGPKPASEPVATTNGHDATAASRFPKIAEAVEAELREARSKVATLEGMLEAFSK